MAECKHSSKSLVEMMVPTIGNVITVQCDVCGAMLPKAPIEDTALFAWMDGALKVPHIDTQAWQKAVDRMIRVAFMGDDLHGLTTFAKVAKK